MLEEYEIDNDGLPSLGIAFSESLYGGPSQGRTDTTGNSKANQKQKGKRLDPALDRWSPPPQDPTLMIPGELVFAREPKGTYYWPAKLQQYVPPTNPKGKPKYRVRFLDESEYDITRETFFTSDEDGFAFCKV